MPLKIPFMSSEPPTEADLINRTRKGDKDAFTRLCALFERRLRCALYRIDRTNVDDLVQEAMLRAWERFNQFNGDAFGYWYLKLGQNQAISVGRRKRPATGIELPESQEGDRDGILAEVIRKLENSDIHQALAACMEELNEKDRDIVRGKFELGDDSVLSERLGMATDALHRRRYKALEQLRACMKRKVS